MSFLIIEELMLFLHALAAGVGLLALYDVLRILRKVFPHGGLLVAVEDISYWIFNALFIFYMMYRENSGTVRAYAVAGIIIGMFAYNLTVSPWVVKWVSWLLSFLLRPFVFVWKHTVGRAFRIVRKMCKILKKRLKKTGKQFTIILQKYYENRVGREDGEKSKNKAQ